MLFLYSFETSLNVTYLKMVKIASHGLKLVFAFKTALSNKSLENKFDDFRGLYF